MRTLLTGEAEGDCSGMGEGVADSDGDAERRGDSSGVTAGDGVGDSCAAAVQAKIAIRNAKLTLVVMSSEVETSRTFSKIIESFLDFAGNDKWPRCNIASSRLERCCRAIHSRAEILRQNCWRQTDHTGG